jgi:hypothetical protein
MNHFFLAALLFVSMSSKGQDSAAIHIVRDTSIWYGTVEMRNLILSNGARIHEGTRLELGKGTQPNGDFMYISTASNTMEAKLKKTYGMKTITIDKIRKVGNSAGAAVWRIVGEKGFYIQLENAIITGEIICPQPKPIVATTKS